MRNHYIPQYYLKGFTTVSNKVWVYEKSKKNKFIAGTRKIAIQNNYFSNETEVNLANQIEAPANDIIRKIKDQEPISSEEKYVLATYMIVIFKRVPSGKKLAQEVFSNMDPVVDKLESEFNNLIAKYPNLKARKQELKELLDKIKSDKNFKEETVDDVWQDTLFPEEISELTEVLSDMSWQFLVNDKEATFLTCDNPVFFFTDIGIGDRRSEVTFPISDKIVLFANWNNGLKRLYSPYYTRAKDADIHEINRRTVFNAEKYVYFSEEYDWVVKLVNKKNLRLKRPLF